VDESEYHFVNGNNLAGGAVRISPSTRCVSEAQFQKYRIGLDDSTLLMSINGTIGNLALYQGESIVLGKSAAFINCGRTLFRGFLFFVLQSPSTQECFQRGLTGTTICNLSLASIRNLPIALPPLREQMEILSALAAEMGRLSELINRARGEISLLREYRTSLIADVVTGKLDVREAAARLPDEAGDEVVLDDHEPVAEDEDESIGVDPDADLEED